MRKQVNFKKVLPKVLPVAVMLVVMMGSQAFAADAFTTKILNFINGTVLTWTRLIGIIGIIAGVAMMGFNRGNDDMTAKAIKVIVGAAIIFGIPEIVNLLLTSFVGTQISPL